MKKLTTRKIKHSFRTEYAASNLLLDIKDEMKITQSKLADFLETTATSLNRKLKSGGFNEDEMETIMEKLTRKSGTDIKYITYLEKKSTRIDADCSREMLQRLLRNEKLSKSGLTKLANKKQTTMLYTINKKTRIKREEIQTFAELLEYQYKTFVLFNGKIIGDEYFSNVQKYMEEHHNIKLSYYTPSIKGINKVAYDFFSEEKDTVIRCKEIFYNSTRENTVDEIKNSVKELLNLPDTTKKILVVKLNPDESLDSIIGEEKEYYESILGKIQLYLYDNVRKIPVLIKPDIKKESQNRADVEDVTVMSVSPQTMCAYALKKYIYDDKGMISSAEEPLYMGKHLKKESNTIPVPAIFLKKDTAWTYVVNSSKEECHKLQNRDMKRYEMKVNEQESTVTILEDSKMIIKYCLENRVLVG